MFGLAALASLGAAPAPLAPHLAHLDWLRRDVKRADGPPLATWQIYATPVKKGDRRGPYRFVGDEDEGVGCVDDVARAAIVYARAFHATGDAKAAAQARDALAFVRAMEAGKGTYYNFVWADGSINQDGPTSKPGLNWWTARALWALAEGVRAFRKPDPAYADALRAAADPTVEALLHDLAARDGTWRTYGALRTPGWFMGEAPDATSVAMLGLAALHRDRPDARAEKLLRRYGAAIAAWAPGAPGTDLDGAHLPSLGPTHWHGYGAHMLHALAEAGAVTGDAALLAAARREADRFTPHLLVSGGPIAGFFPAPVLYPQIAYAVEPQVLGLLALAEATGEPRYATMAGLFGAWLTGANPAKQAMYDPATGRVFDGIDAKGANADSGAESTIEGLLAVQALARRPGLAHLVHAKETGRVGVAFWEAEAMKGARKVPVPGFSGEAGILLAPGATLTLTGRVVPGAYRLTPVVRRERRASGRVTIGPIAGHGGAAPVSRPVLWPPPGAPWPAPELIAADQAPVVLPAAARVPVGLDAEAGAPLELDGLIVQPAVEWRTFVTARGPAAVVVNRSAATVTRWLPGLGTTFTLPPHGAQILAPSPPPSIPPSQEVSVP